MYAPALINVTLRLIMNKPTPSHNRRHLNMDVMRQTSCQISTPSHAEKQITRLVLPVLTTEARAAQQDHDHAHFSLYCLNLTWLIENTVKS